MEREIPVPGTCRSLTLLIAPLLLALSLPASALDDWYQVEVIVFSQRDLSGNEAHPLDPQLDYPQPLRILHTAEQLYPEVPAGAGLNERLAALMVPDRFLSRARAQAPSPYVPLERDERRLNPDAYTLGRNGDYQVLFHSAWQQQVPGARSTPWLAIAGGDRRGEHRQLEGSLRVYKSRFLQLQLDLWMSALDTAVQQSGVASPTSADAPPFGSALPTGVILPTPPQPPMSPALRRLQKMDAGDMFGGGEPTATAGNLVVTADGVDVLNTTHQISLNDITYIDHPRLGALVLITPLKDDGEDNAPQSPDS